MLVEACADILPAFASVDVRTVGEMNVTRKLIEFHPLSLPLFQPVDGSADNRFIYFVDFHAASDPGKQRDSKFPAQMLAEIGETFQQQRPASRVTPPKLVMPQYEPEPLQKSHHTLVLAGRETSGQNRIASVERDADGHGLAVIDFIARQLLELMRRPMTKIERPRRAQFEWIPTEPDLAHVKLGTSLDEVVEMRSGKAHKLFRVGLEPIEKLAVADQGNLHSFGHASS